MKTKITFLITLISLVIISCADQKKVDSERLYNITWELEYISGPRIAFKGLYPDKKPQITFNKKTQKVEGNNSCNGYTADYALDGEDISFGTPEPTTMMYCGEGEKLFLNTMKKINKYSIDKDGKLNLMLDDIPMLQFKKAEKE